MAYGFNDDKSKASLADMIYPVGSIYMSVNNINPSELFGGAWEPWGQGRVPVGVDSSQTEFDSVEKTGGEKKHTLSILEIPSHSHQAGTNREFITLNTKGAVAQLGNGTTDALSGSSRIYPFLSEPFRFDHYGSTGYNTGGNAHNNLQPYITCYMWKRVA